MSYNHKYLNYPLAELCSPYFPLTLYGPLVEFTIKKCFSYFFLILYISNVIKNANIFFPPQKLKIWRHGEKNQLFVYFDQKLKTAILDLFSTKLKVQDLKSKKKKKVNDGPFLAFFAPIRFSLRDPH